MLRLAARFWPGPHCAGLMPPGIPVATVAVDGAKNAAYLACSILSIKHPEIAVRLDTFRQETRELLLAKSAALQQSLGE